MQQRPVAVLALLAAAGDRGCSRDKLIGYLWPDSDEERARHRLADIVYLLRRSLGEDVVLGAGDVLRLNPDVVESDVAALLNAVDSNELETAAALYEGPFLDGFYTSGAPEFERWVESERQRLADVYADALERLAEEAEAAEDYRHAVDLWKRLAAHDAFNSRYVVRLMEALMAAGDPGNALQRAQEHEHLLREELGAEPAPEVLELAERLRREAVREGKSVLEAVPKSSGVEIAGLPAARGGWLTRRRGLAAVAIGVAAVAAAVAIHRGMRTSGSAEATSPNRVAVLPFTVRGSEELAYLEEGMVDLLATALDGAGELTTVDPHALLGFVRRETSGPLDHESGRNVADRFGAGLYILGDVLEAGGRIRASASLYDGTGQPQTSAESVVCGEAQILELADELARQLVAGRPDSAGDRITRLAAVTTESLPALKAYLRAEPLFRAMKLDSAVAEYKRAVAADTAFALAYFRMANAELRSYVSLDVGDAAERARRFSDRLAPRDRQLLECFAAFRRGAANEAERWCHAVLRNHPNDGDAWWWLTMTQFHYGLRRGRPLAEVREALERTLSLDPTHWMALNHLGWLMRIEENRASKLAFVERALAVLDPEDPSALAWRMNRALWRGDSDEQDEIIEELRKRESWFLYIASTATMDFDDGEATVRVLRLLTEPSRSPGYRALGHVLIAHEKLARGQLSAARVELAQAESLNFGPSLKSKAYLWLGPLLPLSREELEGLGEQVATWIPESTWDSLWRLYLLGALHERLDDPGAAEGFAAELETSAAALAPQGDTLRERALARDLALSLRARLAARAERFSEALGFLEATNPEGWWPTGSARAYMKQLHERWLTAEVLVSLGRLEEALNWLAPIGGLDGERSYIGVKHLRMAEIYEQLGDREKAVHHYGRFITFWRDADPELRPRVDAARRAIEALSPDT
ncbi:MAG: hypothetical protein JSV86_03520 [Gemmatimonadota bacterium]|nr:MAG: hypothetical protein JSV86_03520 [Gemmatimonadota bacterium]